MSRKRSFLGRKNFKVKLKKTTVSSLTAILLFAVAGLTWISFLHQGILLTRVNQLLVSQLGLIPVFFLPFPLIIGALMITKIKSTLSEPHVFVGSLVVIIATIGLVHTGSIGRQIWDNIRLFLSTPGAFLFLTAGFGIGFIIMLNIPFEDVLNFLIRFFSQIASALSRQKPDVAPPQMIKRSGMTSSTSASAPQLTKSETPNTSAPSEYVPTPPPSATSAPPRYTPPSLFSENIF